MSFPMKRVATTEEDSPGKRWGGSSIVLEVQVYNTDTNTGETAEVPAESVPSSGGVSQDEIKLLLGHTCKVDLEAKYLRLQRLEQSSSICVNAGMRRSDGLSRLNGRRYCIPTEVVLMHKAAGGPELVGKSAAVNLLDWYDVDDVIVLVMERPILSGNLLRYMNENLDLRDESKAKIIMKQLLEAAIDLQKKGVFHRDLKPENILIELSPAVPRVRIIDFGSGCIFNNNRYYYLPGTHTHAPPEFLKRGEYTPGPITVWQLGVLVFEMLDTSRRFSTQGFLKKEIQIKMELSYECQDLLRRCLASKPQDRATLKQLQQHPWLNPTTSTIFDYYFF
ncbi:serine/threonine-protein kinase pim-1-like [Hippoglossus hippoglossus]|uniref:serine/threonine-protein kinase pim-1-like n=1 Tax=Hippoglossus hippoglossus TaxID=8267 RepID=UPI00148C20CA|nr:serine/threonine-protein kinase pim-1-like [Hippoglossus hippoglossus]